jgi:hypothetical protein
VRAGDAPAAPSTQLSQDGIIRTVTKRNGETMTVVSEQIRYHRDADHRPI